MTSNPWINEVLNIFSKFSLDNLPYDWVTNVIDSDFTEVDDIPTEFEDVHCATNFNGLFKAQVNALRQWVDLLPLPKPGDDHPKSASFVNSMNETVAAPEDVVVSKFWVDFAKIVKVKNLMSLLFYYVHKGQQYDSKQDGRDLGSQAASLYFLLLCIPGSNAFRVFHPVLFLKALDTLRLATKFNVAGVNSPRKGGGCKQAGRVGSQRRNTDDALSSQGAEGDDEDENELALLTPQEANQLVRLLNVLLGDFIRFAQRFSLKHSPESLDETICTLVEVTRCETHNAHSVFLGNHGSSTVTSLTYNSYVALQCISSNLHGNTRKIVTLILKHILYNILMISRVSSDLSVRALGVIRDHSVIFVKYLLTQLKESAYDGVYVLVQHLCLRVPDKADFRQKTSQSVVEILRHLPVHQYTRLMKWFFKFSHNEKAGHRLFTLEIISKMLCEEERQAEDGTIVAATSTQNISISSGHEITAAHAEMTMDNSFNIIPVDHAVIVPNNRNILSHKFLLGIIFSRCRDSAASVRSKALGLLAECTLSENPTIMQAMKQIFSKDQPVVFTTPHIHGNEVNIESPIEQLHESSDEQEYDMPNAVMVMSLLRRRARDDKVTVRKSALQVMENLMKLDKEMISQANLKVRKLLTVLYIF